MKLIMIMILIVLGLSLWLIYDFKKGKKNPKLIQSYRENGLSDKDITIFRQTMTEAKDQIKQWENAVKQDADLQIIEGVTGGLESAKKLFQLIVKHPRIALSNNVFLYKELPTMVALIETYHNLKHVDRLGQELLVDSQKVIRQLSGKIAEQYEETVRDDIEKIKNEVEHG